MHLPTPSTTPNPSELFAEARTTCRELTSILLDENQGLPQHNVAAVEARLASKKRLTLRLEKLLHELKTTRPSWAAAPHLAGQATHLAEEVRLLMDYSSTNAQLLRAAHTIRAEVVQTIRNTLEATAPKVQLYGATGAMRPVSAGTTVLAREV